jgi:putative transposase
VGQKNKITRRWARRGTRPAAPHDQRTQSAYIFGALCPAAGKAAGLVLPRCNTQAMALHLEEISQAVAPGAQAVVLLDQAGWHSSRKLPVPDNLTLLHLPAKSPELNPAENVWQFLRDNWLSNRLRLLPRDPRPLPLRLEQPRRSALADHLHRPARVGSWVLISESWHKIR